MPAMVTLDQSLQIEWRSAVSDAELVDLTRSHGGQAEVGWWDRVHPHSLGWVTARTETGELVGFVNVAWDGGDHAFLIDTKTRPTHQRRGLGVAVVRRAIAEAQAAGCEWLFRLRTCADGVLPRRMRFPQHPSWTDPPHELGSHRALTAPPRRFFSLAAHCSATVTMWCCLMSSVNSPPDPDSGGLKGHPASAAGDPVPSVQSLLPGLLSIRDSKDY